MADTTTISRFSGLDLADGDASPLVADAPNSAAFSLPAGRTVFKVAGIGADGVQRNAIGLESTDAHRHVAKVWQNKCTSLPNFMAKVASDALTHVDEMFSMQELRPSFDESTGNLCLSNGAVLSVSALSALCERYTDVPGNVPAWMMGADYGKQLAWLIREGLGKHVENLNAKKAGHGESARAFVRQKETESGRKVRTIMSSRYGVINNTDALEMLAMSLPGGALDDVLMSHTNYDENNLHGNLLVPDYALDISGDSEYGVGVQFKNSEVGDFTFSVSPFLFRAICLNGLIWDRAESVVKVNKKHLGTIDFDVMRLDVKNAVRVALTQGHSLSERMQDARTIGVQNVPALIGNLARSNRLTIAQGRKWFESYTTDNYEPTAFGIVNGLTAAARSFSGSERGTMESVAGRILTPTLEASQDSMLTEWEKAVARANDAAKTDEKGIMQYVYARS